MKKILSILVAVLMFSVTFAQTQSRETVIPVNRALRISPMTVNPQVKTVAATRSEQLMSTLDYAASTMAEAMDTIEVFIPNPILNNRIVEEGWFQIRGTTEDRAYYATFSNSDSRTTLLGNYSYASFDLDWSYVDINGFNGADTVRVNVTDGHATMTRTADGYLFEAYYVGHDDHCYHITMNYIIPAFENALDTVEVAIENPVFIDYTPIESGFFFVGYNADSSYAAEMLYGTTSVTGDFVLSDFYMANTGLYRKVNGRLSLLSVVDVKATVTEAGGAYDVDAWFLVESRTSYHVTLHYVIPVATDTIEVNVPAAAFETVEGGWFTPTTQHWSGVSDNGTYNVTMIYTASEAEGDYYFCSLDNTSKVNAVTFVDGHLTVTALEGNAGYALEAYMLGRDMHCYHINMTYTRPTLEDATDTVELDIPSASLSDRTSTTGAFQIYGYTEDQSYAVSLTVNANQIPGTYTYGDFNLDYVYVGEMTTLTRISVLDGHATVTATDEGYAVDAYLLGTDLHCYHATMTYTIPVATDTVDFQITDPILTDFMASEGWFQLRGWSTDGNYYASFSNKDIRTQIAGEYDFSSFDWDYCFVVVVDGTDTAEVTLVDGHVTVTATESAYILDAFYLGEDLHGYHFTMTYVIPVATDTIELACAGSATLNDYSDYDGSYMFIGCNADSTMAAHINYRSSTIEGSFTMADCDADYTKVVLASSGVVDVYSAEITVAATDYGYFVEAYLLCVNNHCYHVTMQYGETGINTANKVEVKVYPNPATDVLHIKADGITRIELIDAAGRVALTTTQPAATINVSGLANGVYMLRTTTREGVNVQRIVKK